MVFGFAKDQSLNIILCYVIVGLIFPCSKFHVSGVVVSIDVGSRRPAAVLMLPIQAPVRSRSRSRSRPRS